MDHTDRRGFASVRHMLDIVMPGIVANVSPHVLDVVALLADRPGEGLSRGQVGTVVESLQEENLLVEFSDDDGRAYAVISCPRQQLLVLHYAPQPA